MLVGYIVIDKDSGLLFLTYKYEFFNKKITGAHVLEKKFGSLEKITRTS
jgi:hypothetical protein